MSEYFKNKLSDFKDGASRFGSSASQFVSQNKTPVIMSAILICVSFVCVLLTGLAHKYTMDSKSSTDIVLAQDKAKTASNFLVAGIIMQILLFIGCIIAFFFIYTNK